MTVTFCHQNITANTFIGMTRPVDVYTVDVELYEPCSIQNPKFILDYNADILTCNYAYCPTLKRQYFISNIDFAPGGQMIITCKTDLLNTLGMALLYAPIVINRATTRDGNATYIKDMQLPLLSDKTIDTYKLNVDYNPFITDIANIADYLYVLTVAGGQAVQPGGE